MKKNSYVIDANVFLEYVYNRKLSYKSKKILQDAILQRIKIFVPSLFFDEITEVFCGNLNDCKKIEEHLRYLENLAKEQVLNIVVPDSVIRMKAIEIARTGNKKNGYPELADSLYHAVAILNKSIFITNDIKHIVKVKKFGYIQELQSY